MDGRRVDKVLIAIVQDSKSKRAVLMAPTLVVRNAREQDVPALADFNIAMAQETENKRLSPAKGKAGMRAVLRHPDHGF